MPYTLIQGTFHLVNQTQNGSPSGFEPDGDSIHFKPTNPALLDRLKRLDQPYRLTNIGSVNLRIEGIDSLELHYRPDGGGPNSHQPRPLADDARDFLTAHLGLGVPAYSPPRRVRIKPPVAQDATPGYILSRSLEVHGRPVSFVFAGDPPQADGSQVFLTVPMLENSLNFQSVLQGHAYPLFYDTLFVELREALAKAVQAARIAGRGLWPQDVSQAGVSVTQQSDLENDGVIFPKLFRRLTDYLARGNVGVGGFLSSLADTDEQILDLTDDNFTHFDTIVSVNTDTVSMTRAPEEVVFISAK
jgi:endonuclease YncB( thermonuclease family)